MNLSYQELQNLHANDKIAIGIDTSLARKFYTNLSLSEIEKNTGESPKLQKYIIQLANIGNPLFLLGSILFAVFAFNWWALLVVPLFIGIYAFFRSAATMGANMSVINTIIGGVIIGSFFINFLTTMQWITIFIFLMSLWFANFLYAGSANFLRKFILRNRKCYEWLKSDLIIKNKETT